MELTGAEFIEDYFVEQEQIFYQQPSGNIIELEQGKPTAFVTTALKAEYSRMFGAKSGSESGRTEKDKNINAWNSDRCHSLHNSSFLSFVSLQLIGLINHIECR